VDRRVNWPPLRDIIAAWLDERFTSVDEALAVLEKARIPCAPVLRPADLIASPHLAERAFFPSVPHPTHGPVRVTASPYHLDGLPIHPRAGAPYRVGEHTRAVLAGVLAYSDTRIAELLSSRIVDAP
jgi:crotonobetainyl-CoA:carnitine CoA-transferase CaiB-like acyl-CoA transferase